MRYARAPIASRWPPTRQLWVLIVGLALFDVVVTIAADRSGGPSIQHGQDFMAFYSAGRLALAGDGPLIYDLPTLAAVQHAIAAGAPFAMSAPVAPFLNPPHVALLFAPLAAAFGFNAALFVWTLFGVACLLTSAWLLARIVGEASPLRRHRWLTFAAVCGAPPTLLALGHGQNTPLSLLLLTLAVVAWRTGRPVAAGLAIAMLAYKPHLAAIVGVACWLTMGRRVLLGGAIGGVVTLMATWILMPDALTAFATRMPGNAEAIFFDQTFRWQRHATILGFARHLFHGNGPGPTQPWAVTLAGLAIAALAVALARTWWRHLRPTIARGDEPARDRLIAAVVLATPLLVPYFVDYDLSLLLVAAVLVARDDLASGARDAWRRRVAMLAYAWLVVNPIAAEAIGVSLTTPLLATVLILHLRRCATHRVVAATNAVPVFVAVRRAA